MISIKNKMFLPTHLFVSKENKNIDIKLLQEVKNFIFMFRETYNEPPIEFDFNSNCKNKSYILIQIRLIAGRIYIPIDRVHELYKFVGGIGMKKVIDFVDEEIVDLV
jgi:hypothetical protein